MASTSNIEQVGIPEIVEGITAAILAPVTLPLSMVCLRQFYEAK